MVDGTGSDGWESTRCDDDGNRGASIRRVESELGYREKEEGRFVGGDDRQD